ncbi:bile acid:sodium symporter family protein [Falsiphaeobacter marinintestinus]|uniref:bile acid:sodium symporter family protein n=1 Tax=Falsiphaeobacter marinintestinus TaxID=1492905 RepID=UPI0011B4F944|nr:bile acid:sodium symporter family protein [Phaeobacter marinintestinus]
MEELIGVGLPLALAVIMLSLGIGLEVSDFRRVALNGHAFVIGALSQIILLPLTAFFVVSVFAPPPGIAAGVMLLAFCPGGVTSNILSKLAGGDVALSISLTAMVSLTSILTVPMLSAWAIPYFLGSTAPELNVTSLAIAMFLITTLPVAVGVTIRQYFRGAAIVIDPILSRVAVVLVVLVIAAALADNWALFLENLPSLGAMLLIVNLVLLGIGFGVARLAGLGTAQIKTITLEIGIQNSTLGITMAGLITGVTFGFSALALPSAVYGITMYVVAVPFILWMRGGRAFGGRNHI